MPAIQSLFDFDQTAIVRPVAEDWQYATGGIEEYTFGGNKAWRVANLRPLVDGRFNGLECNILPSEYPEPTHNRQRLVVACGMGTDSIAMLCLLHKLGIRPDVVSWADTGSERQHTYRYISVLQAWLKSVGWPPLLIVRKRCPQAGHRGLVEQVWNTEQLPSAAFHKNHSCSIKWKLDPQRDWQKRCDWLWTPFTTAIGFDMSEAGTRRGIKEAVGFDGDEATSRRSMRYQLDKNDGDYEVWLPLAEHELDRQGCMDLIAEYDLPQPGKSACFICPISSLCEVKAMQYEEPETLDTALAIERRYRDGRHYQGEGATIQGLGVAMPGRDTWNVAATKQYSREQLAKGSKVGLVASDDLPALDVTLRSGEKEYKRPAK